MDVTKSDQEQADGVNTFHHNTSIPSVSVDPPLQLSTSTEEVPLTPTPPPAVVPSASPPPLSTTTPSSSSVQSFVQQQQPQIMEPPPSTSPQPQVEQVDPQILEALRSKDRIFVLKLGETFEALIKESRLRVELAPNSSYHRLLVHRCSAYYKLVPESDPQTKGIAVVCTPESRIPDRRLCDLIPPEPHTHPAIKIMRRPQSMASSVAGEEADLSDVEPSESGSLGGRSNPSSIVNNPSHSTNTGNSKKHMTIEEREAAYKMARERIFMDFQEKPEKGKGKDAESGVSASSSLLSLNGGGSTSASASSTSAGGRSSFLGDTDDAASSPATESEWSGPIASGGGGGIQHIRGEHHGNKREGGGRRGGPGSTSASSSRSLRNDRGFHGSGSGSSSRNSRAPSPSSSFAYPTLYEPPPSAGQIYDPNQHHQHQQAAAAAAHAVAAAGMAYMNPANQYAATYQYTTAPGQGPSYMTPAAYPYYAQPYHPYPLQHMAPHPPPQTQQTHPSQHNAGDHTSPPPPPPPPGSEPYSPQHPHQPPMNYGHPYVWGQPAPHPQAMQSPPPPAHVHAIPHPHAHPTHPSHQQSHSAPGTHSMGPPPPPPPPPAGPPPSSAGAYPAYPAYGYTTQPLPMNGYYQPPQHQVPVGAHPPGTAASPPHGPPTQQHGYADPRSINGHVPLQGHGSSPGHHTPNNAPQGGHSNQRDGYGSPSNNMNGTRNNRSASNNSGGGSGGGVGKNRSGPPGANPSRAPWSYGPNVGGGSTVQGHGGSGYGYGMGGSETNLGPRFTATHRRPSGNSSSGNSRASSNFDDGSSIASTSSSSTSTNTLVSTASSQHPLPQRPDWAVGLKAQPSLTGGRHMSGNMSSSPMRTTSSHNSTASSTSSNSSRHGSNHTSPMPPASMDFPPLTTGASAGVIEKKVPVPGGAWGVPRNLNGTTTHADGERGAGKVGEIINPKIVRRPSGPQQPNGGQASRPQQQSQSPQQQGQQADNRTRDVIEQVSGLTLEENEADAVQVSTPVVAPTSPATAASLAAPSSTA